MSVYDGYLLSFSIEIKILSYIYNIGNAGHRVSHCELMNEKAPPGRSKSLTTGSPWNGVGSCV
nr:MAG TPA: hypothetical protein [Caudoviricetes sp.]